MTTMASRFLRESMALFVSALALTAVAAGCSSSTDDASPTACGQLTCSASQWCLLSTGQGTQRADAGASPSPEAGAAADTGECVNDPPAGCSTDPARPRTCISRRP